MTSHTFGRPDRSYFRFFFFIHSVCLSVFKVMSLFYCPLSRWCSPRHLSWVFLPVLAAVAISIHMLSWRSIIKWNQFSSISTTEHYGDIVSNLINCFFVLRVSYLSHHSAAGGGYLNTTEPIVMILQSLGSLFIMYHPYSVIYDPSFNKVLKCLLVIQLVASWLVALSYLVSHPKGCNVSQLISETNNTLMPIFMVYSFVLVNVHFPFILEDSLHWDSQSIGWLVFIYELAIVGTKMYCITIYIIYQIQRDTESDHHHDLEEGKLPCSEVILKKRVLSIKHRVFLFVGALLIVADAVYIGMYYLYSRF